MEPLQGRSPLQIWNSSGEKLNHSCWYWWPSYTNRWNHCKGDHHQAVCSKICLPHFFASYAAISLLLLLLVLLALFLQQAFIHHHYDKLLPITPEIRCFGKAALKAGKSSFHPSLRQAFTHHLPSSPPSLVPSPSTNQASCPPLGRAGSTKPTMNSDTFQLKFEVIREPPDKKPTLAVAETLASAMVALEFRHYTFFTPNHSENNPNSMATLYRAPANKKKNSFSHWLRSGSIKANQNWLWSGVSLYKEANIHGNNTPGRSRQRWTHSLRGKGGKVPDRTSRPARHQPTRKCGCPCNQCSKSFTQKSILVAHMKTHKGEKNYLCYQCNKSFILRSYLVTHMKTHTGEKDHSCEQCSRSFSLRGTLVVENRKKN